MISKERVVGEAGVERGTSIDGSNEWLFPLLPVVHALCVRWTPGYRIRHPGVQRACEHGLQELLLSSMLRSTPASLSICGPNRLPKSSRAVCGQCLGADRVAFSRA